MTESQLNAAGFAELAEELFAAASPTETAEQVVAMAQAELEADVVGLTMIRGGGRLETVAATGPIAVEADRLQTALADGPCRGRSWSQHAVISSQLARDELWPIWAPRVSELGVSSLVVIELCSEHRRIGVLSLYWRQPQVFADDDIALAHVFARHAALAIASAERGANLEVALDGRKLIGMAQGILMERYGLDDARAFEVLKRYSQDHNIKLRRVAADLVATRALPAEFPLKKQPSHP